MKILFLFITLFLFVSCNKSRNNSLKEIDDISLLSLEYDFCSENEKSHESDSISFIPLETNDNSLISNIDKILYKKGRYYIFDRVQAVIFLFNSNGTFITKIHKTGNGPGEYSDVSDFDIDANSNVYVSSVAGRKIIKYLYPDYKSFTEYKTNATVLEMAVDEKTERIWVTSVFQTMDGICLGYYSEGEIVPVIPSRGISDHASTEFKSQSFYKSEDDLFFNPRYSPYIYKISKDEASKYAKIISDNFSMDSDIESENDFKKKNGMRVPYDSNKCIVSGVKSFYQCRGKFLMEIWKNHGAPLLLEYDQKNGNGTLFSPFADDKIKTYTKILGATSDFYISYISASSFLADYRHLTKNNLREDSNPVLMNIYLKP